MLQSLLGWLCSIAGIGDMMSTANPSLWIETHLGNKFYYDDPHDDLSSIHIEDIAHSLSKIQRFAGHSAGWTVLEHSLLVCEIVKRDYPYNHAAQLHGLIHDAHESYIGDIPTPFKRFAGLADAERSVMSRVERAIAPGLDTSRSEAIVKRADLEALYVEKTEILKSLHKWSFEDQFSGDVDTSIIRKASGFGQMRFIEEYERLTDKCKQAIT